MGGHQSQSPSQSLNGSHHWVTFLDPGVTSEEDQASAVLDFRALPDLGPDLKYFLQGLAAMQGEGNPSQGPRVEDYEDWIKWRGHLVDTPTWWQELAGSWE